jgi:hypothetical protein
MLKFCVPFVCSFIILRYLFAAFITHPTAVARASPAPTATPQFLIFPGLHSGVLAAAIMASDSIPSAKQAKRAISHWQLLWYLLLLTKEGQV